MVDVTYETADRIHVKISDPNNARWEVPADLLPPPAAPGCDPSSSNVQFSYTDFPFGFAITRSLGGDVLFNTTTDGSNFNGLVFEDQYLEVSTALPAGANIYGLGEHVNAKLLLNKDGSYHTMVCMFDVILFCMYIFSKCYYPRTSNEYEKM